eukprot:6561689-Prymnesium_polylepis.1
MAQRADRIAGGGGEQSGGAQGERRQPLAGAGADGIAPVEPGAKARRGVEEHNSGRRRARTPDRHRDSVSRGGEGYRRGRATDVRAARTPDGHPSSVSDGALPRAP